ncbi:hypothetical protein IFR08_19470 [Pseudomonas fluorescens]|uniref:hypothetical protein n=1 Tax=Pseudomonas fluorescens TaxID=294 RepID=UPI0012FEA8AC|nr:hypothetical protein [Pseudomonas fluorescens]MBD8098071.1 hypothetical protein [Pseudomonas fluorescens]MBD8775910.1 hypothetical protein [Pseudomonas fluorescens]MBD8782552.1 hypothetical protein [Pseudomonas fluorescens]MBD8795621.1 hypothetical protein [Pseudomonas fluorescens]
MKNGWKVGDDVYNQTAKGKDPSWSAVRARFWKNEASAPDAASTYGSENLDRMSKGLAPQRYNADKGGVESMELSHEPIPARDEGTTLFLVGRKITPLSILTESQDIDK